MPFPNLCCIFLETCKPYSTMNTAVAGPATCPRCKNVIRPDDINVTTDIAFCRVCNVPHQFSDLVSNTKLEEGVDFQRPPAGAWYHSSPLETIIGATHRSLGAALGLLMFSLFWNGIVSIFVVIALSGTLANLGVTLPHWFPAPKMNGGAMSIGMTIFLWLFLTPFIAVGLGMLAAFFSTLAGRTEIRLRATEGTIRVGVGAIGWQKKFQLPEMSEVRLLDQTWRDSDGDARQKKAIILKSNEGKELKFGSMLTDERRKFLAAALRKHLHDL
jgi:hypothetical protein